MTDFWGIKAKAHRANLDRYCRLLATPLTDVERAFIHKRIAEERTALEELEATSADTVAQYA
jgi:hypothetical protein